MAIENKIESDAFDRKEATAKLEIYIKGDEMIVDMDGSGVELLTMMCYTIFDMAENNGIGELQILSDFNKIVLTESSERVQEKEVVRQAIEALNPSR